MAKHTFLTGEKQVGKSTLLRKLIEKTLGPVSGFFTVKTDRVYDGRFSVHLLQAAGNERPTPENLLFFCGELWTEETGRRFDQLGCAALMDYRDAKLLVMDELGPTEAQAEMFQAAVLRALNGNVPILGVLQKAESTFLEKVADHPEVRVFEVTVENRDMLAHMLTE